MFSTNEDILLAWDKIFTYIPAPKFAKTFQKLVGRGALKSTVAILKK